MKFILSISDLTIASILNLAVFIMIIVFWFLDRKQRKEEIKTLENLRNEDRKAIEATKSRYI